MLGVMTLPAVRDTAADGLLDGFEVGYVAEDGTQHRLPLADVWAVRFEVMAPVRRFAARKGQRHLPGRWWSATNGSHVGYESAFAPAVPRSRASRLPRCRRGPVAFPAVTDLGFLDSTRSSYDVVAAGYSALFADQLLREPVLRSMLTLFAELAPGRAADVGCGPGHVTAFLHKQGLDDWPTPCRREPGRPQRLVLDHPHPGPGVAGRVG
jgi:hypothetical protein